MECSPSWESNGFSASEEIFHIFSERKVHYCICKSLLLLRSLMNPARIYTSYFSMILSYSWNSQHFMWPKEAVLCRIQVFWFVWLHVAGLVFTSVFKNVVPSSSCVERSKENAKCRRQVEMYRSVSPFGEGSKTLTLTLITLFTRPHHWSLSQAIWIQSSPLSSHTFKIHFNIILLSTPRSSKWLSYFRFYTQYHVFISLERVGLYAL
jgi:hypothetical protein